MKLVGDSPFIGALVLKALRGKDAGDQLLREAYHFISVYCDLLGPLISFSVCEMDFLLSHLGARVAQVEETGVPLLERRVPKRGKRSRADLNVEAPAAAAVDPMLQSLALQAIASLLLTDPASVSESSFKALVDRVAREAVLINVNRYAMGDGCVYSHAGCRKALYSLLEVLAKYPLFPFYRPLHVALHVFSDVMRWDTQAADSAIPTFCRNALLTLQLITDPVIAPKVLGAKSHSNGADGEEEDHGSLIDEPMNEDLPEDAVSHTETGNKEAAAAQAIQVEPEVVNVSRDPEPLITLDSDDSDVDIQDVQVVQLKGARVGADLIPEAVASHAPTEPVPLAQEQVSGESGVNSSDDARHVESVPCEADSIVTVIHKDSREWVGGHD